MSVRCANQLLPTWKSRARRTVSSVLPSFSPFVENLHRVEPTLLSTTPCTLALVRSEMANMTG